MDRFRLGKVAPSLRAMDGEKVVVSTDAKTNTFHTYLYRPLVGISALNCILCSLRFLRWLNSHSVASAVKRNSSPQPNRCARLFRFPAVSGPPVNERFESFESCSASLALSGSVEAFELTGASDYSSPRQRPPQSFREFRMQQKSPFFLPVLSTRNKN